MKKSILILFLFSIVAQAQYTKAVVYMKNGTQKEGLAKMVFSNNAKVNFKKDENSKNEKIATLDIKKIIYTNEGQTIITMEPFYLITPSILTNKFSKSEKKYWSCIVYDKKQKIGRIDDKGDKRNNNYRAVSSSYYFGTSESEELVFGYITTGSLVKSYGTDATMKKMGEEAFVDCPAINEAIKKESFQLKNALEQITALFDSTECK
jgi:hypothetical protein